MRTTSPLWGLAFRKYLWSPWVCFWKIQQGCLSFHHRLEILLGFFLKMFGLCLVVHNLYFFSLHECHFPLKFVYHLYLNKYLIDLIRPRVLWVLNFDADFHVVKFIFLSSTIYVLSDFVCLFCNQCTWILYVSPI